MERVGDGGMKREEGEGDEVYASMIQGRLDYGACSCTFVLARCLDTEWG